MFVAKNVCMPSSVNGDELCCTKLDDLKFGNVLTTHMESAVLEAEIKFNGAYFILIGSINLV